MPYIRAIKSTSIKVIGTPRMLALLISKVSTSAYYPDSTVVSMTYSRRVTDAFKILSHVTSHVMRMYTEFRLRRFIQ